MPPDDAPLLEGRDDGIDPEEIERDRIRRRIVQVDVDYFKHSTDLARLVVVGMLEYWIPESQIFGERGTTLAIPRWLAQEKGLPFIELQDFTLVRPAQRTGDDDIPF